MMKFRGVSKHATGGYVAHIGREGIRIYLGWFADFDAAKEARLQAEIRLFGATFDRREIVVRDDCAYVPLHGRGGVFKGYAQVDAEDLALVCDIAWSIDARGYVAGRPKESSKTVTLHRHIYGPVAGRNSIDHIDGDRLNNRRSNLRECSQAENTRNARIGLNNTSGYKGVSETAEGRWRARITVDGVEIRIGHFDTAEEAAEAYDSAAVRLHGDFAATNAALLARRRIAEEAA